MEKYYITEFEIIKLEQTIRDIEMKCIDLKNQLLILKEVS